MFPVLKNLLMWILVSIEAATKVKNEFNAVSVAYRLTSVGFVCVFWHSFIITTLSINSSSHSASGPGQPLRLFLSSWRDWEAVYILDWMCFCLQLFWLGVCCLSASCYCNIALILVRVHIWCHFECIKRNHAWLLSVREHFCCA